MMFSRGAEYKTLFNNDKCIEFILEPANRLILESKTAIQEERNRLEKIIVAEKVKRDDSIKDIEEKNNLIIQTLEADKKKMIKERVD